MSGFRDCILVVEDDAILVMGLMAQLEDMGREVCGTAASAAEAVRKAVWLRPRVVLMDMRLEGDGDGVDATIAINATVGSKVIFATASTDPATRRRIDSVRPLAVLTKPISTRELKAAVDAAYKAA